MRQRGGEVGRADDPVNVGIHALPTSAASSVAVPSRRDQHGPVQGERQQGDAGVVQVPVRQHHHLGGADLGGERLVVHVLQPHADPRVRGGLLRDRPAERRVLRVPDDAQARVLVGQSWNAASRSSTPLYGRTRPKNSTRPGTASPRGKRANQSR